MSTAATERIPASAFVLNETASVALTEGSQEDGTVLLHVIRPGVGRGKGRHLYEAEMLERNAENFKGWKMFVDHLSPEARRAAGGLPRSWRDYGGKIVESWWDPDVPANDRFGQGAVVARARPFGVVAEIIKHDPDVMEASISTAATGISERMHNGERVLVVEGIDKRGSVDWVTEAGAGGRVVSLMEAASFPDMDADELHELSDEQLLEHLKETRPELAEALTPPSDTNEEDEMGVTPEALQEALQDESVRETLQETLQEAVREQVEEHLPVLVEAAISAERDAIHAEASALAERKLTVRDLRDKAHEIIEADRRLPQAWKAQVKGVFDLTEAGPTPALDVIEDIDDEGAVIKTAEAKLVESVQAEVARQHDLLAAANPTRVSGQGPTRVEEGETPEGDEGKHGPQTQVGSLLQEAGFDDPEKVWA